jgi:hypothetical protein
MMMMISDDDDDIVSQAKVCASSQPMLITYPR